MSDYHSFLICFHGGQTDVYRNGLPIGVLSGNEFRPHKTVLASGEVRTAEYPESLPDLVREVLEKMEEAK